MRSLTEFDDLAERPAYEGQLSLLDGTLAIGDADSMVTFNDLDYQTRVRIFTLDSSDSGAGDIRIDLAPQA